MTDFDIAKIRAHLNLISYRTKCDVGTNLFFSSEATYMPFAITLVK